MNKRLIGGIATALLPLCNTGIAGSGNYGYAGARGQKHQPLVTNHAPWLRERQHRTFLESAQLNIKSEQIELMQGQTANELVIIDSTIPDKHIIYQNSGPEVDVVEIKPGKSGVSQLKKILAQYYNLDAMHVFTHADDGVIKLGDSHVTQASLTKEINTLASIDSAMKDGADLYFYGCDLARTEQGEALLELISHNANVDVAASNDKTGHSDLGGDWDLEISKGDIDKQVRYDSIAMSEFEMVLPYTGTLSMANLGANYYANTGNAYFSQYTYTIPGTSYDMYVSSNGGGYDHFTHYYGTSQPGLAVAVSGTNVANPNTKSYIEFTNGEVFDLNSLVLYSQFYGVNAGDIPAASAVTKLFKFTSDKGGVVTQGMGFRATETISFSGALWTGIKKVTIEYDDGDGFEHHDISNVAISNLRLPPAPGGNSADLELWLRADVGGNAWTDESGNNVTVTPVNSPALSADLLNFNPQVTFNGSNQYYNLTSAAFATGNADRSIYVVSERNTNGGAIYNVSLGLQSSGQASANMGHWANYPGAPFISSNTQQVSSSDGLWLINTPAITNYAVNSAANSLSTNGRDLILALDNSTLNISNASIGRIGAFATNPAAGYWSGNIAEAIVYNAGHATGTEKQQIESYLALKYGITLDQATATAYLASDGTSKMWGESVNAAYNKDIFGIGRDDDQALDQRVSKSVNSGSVMTVALDDDFVSANTSATRTTTFANDLEFVTLANNGSPTTTQVTEIAGNDSNGTPFGARISREWQVQNPAALTGMNVKFDGFAGFELIQSTDSDFSTAGDQAILATLDANGEATNLTFANGAFLTLAPPTPVLTDFSSTTPNATYGAGDEIQVCANYDIDPAPGSSMTVTLDTGATVMLTGPSAGAIGGNITFDPSFIPPIHSASITQITVQPDGKILTNGTFINYDGIVGQDKVARLDTNGNRDTSFLLDAPFTGTPSVALAPDGKIWVGGSFANYNGDANLGRLVRLNPNGTLDTSSNHVRPGNNVSSIGVQPDGKVIIAGAFTNYDGVGTADKMARLNADGTHDTSFVPAVLTLVSEIFIQPDGKILFSGNFTDFDGVATLDYLARLNADGSRDTSFIPDVGFPVDGVEDVGFLSDGRIVVVGSWDDYDGQANLDDIVVLNADGSRDTAFSPVPFPTGLLNAVHIEANDTIFVGGNFTNYDGQAAHDSITRINPDGTRDTTFNPSVGAVAAVNDIARLQDGRIALGGSFT